MKKFYLSFLLCILSVALVSADVLSNEQDVGLTEDTAVVVEEVSNIPPNFQSKSPTKAFLFSAIIPGTGEIYAGAKRGYIQIIAEVGFIAAAIITNRQAEGMRDDYNAKVREHVKFDSENFNCKEFSCSFDTWNHEDYEHATMYDNWHNVYTESDGKPLERVGAFYWEDRENVKDEDRQRNPDSQNREEALKLREDSNDRFQISKTFIGLIIANHIISAIDARIMAKIYNERQKRDQNLSFRMIIHPNSSIESQFVFRRRF